MSGKEDLHPGEERMETVRTREEILSDPDPYCSPSCGSKFVRTEDTFRRVRCYNPPNECFPPPAICYGPDMGYFRQCRECPPRCPGGWEGRQRLGEQCVTPGGMHTNTRSPAGREPNRSKSQTPCATPRPNWKTENSKPRSSH